MNAIHDSSTTAVPQKNGPGFFRRNWPLFFVVLLGSTNLCFEPLRIMMGIDIVCSIICLKYFNLLKKFYIYAVIPLSGYILLFMFNNYISYPDNKITCAIVLSIYISTLSITILFFFFRNCCVNMAIKIWITIFFLSPLYFIPYIIIYVSLYGFT